MTDNTKRLAELQLRAEAGLITQAESDELVHLLLNDEEAFESYVADLQLQASLTWRLSGLQQSSDYFDQELITVDAGGQSPAEGSSAWDLVVDQALALRRQHEVEDEANRQLAAQQAEDARNRRFELRRNTQPAPVKRVIVIPRVAIAGLVAAILLVVAGVVYEANKPEVSTPPEAVVESPVRPRDMTPTIVDPVATLLAVHQPVWGEEGTWPQVGGGLLPGRYELVSGVAQIEFNSGATVLVEAPARFELVDDNAGRLELGALTASVPQPAQGFTVSTPGGEFVDLGTEFGVRVTPMGDIQSHVFDGEILASTAAQQGLNSSPILLREEEGVAVSGGVVTQQPQPGGFIRGLDDEHYRVELSGDVEQVFAAPASLEMDRYQCDGLARLIVESRGVQLRGNERLTATLTGPGQMQHPPRAINLDLGTMPVDSYVLHFDSASDHPVGTEQTITGQVTFPRPVLAVQCGLEELQAGDSVFGVSGTAYPAQEQSRGWYYRGGGEQAQGDWLWLSDDRKTMRFQIKANNIDQCRILIEAVRPRESDG